jgi:hypothetical protein
MLINWVLHLLLTTKNKEKVQCWSGLKRLFMYVCVFVYDADQIFLFIKVEMEKWPDLLFFFGYFFKKHHKGYKSFIYLFLMKWFIF